MTYNIVWIGLTVVSGLIVIIGAIVFFYHLYIFEKEMDEEYERFLNVTERLMKNREGEKECHLEE